MLVIRGPWGTGSEHEIVSVPVDGGEPRVLTTGNDRRYLALHPEGRRLAFAGGSMRTELWVLERLSEAVAASRGVR